VVNLDNSDFDTAPGHYFVEAKEGRVGRVAPNERAVTGVAGD